MVYQLLCLSCPCVVFALLDLPFKGFPLVVVRSCLHRYTRPNTINLFTLVVRSGSPETAIAQASAAIGAPPTLDTSSVHQPSSVQSLQSSLSLGLGQPVGEASVSVGRHK